MRPAWTPARWIASILKRTTKFAGHDMIYIDPVECIDCGACVPVCPVSAIFALDDLPEKWADYAQKNASISGDRTLFMQRRELANNAQLRR